MNLVVSVIYGYDFRCEVFKHIISDEYIKHLLWNWMQVNTMDDESTSVQVMAWRCQAPSHYPKYLMPYGATRPQWVNSCSVNELLKIKEDLTKERDELLSEIVKLREGMSNAQDKLTGLEQDQEDSQIKIQEVRAEWEFPL